jgi:mannosyltransferase OCH1-like enzyme
MNIPKIIHHISPSNKEDWHPVWESCFSSWKNHFSEEEYTYMMWDDFSIDLFVKNNFSEYWELYKSFPYHIMRIDFARFCILYKYGGIYADMDMYCYNNFYDDLNKSCCLVGSLSKNEIVQNSLMVSTPKNNFLIKCMEKSKEKFVLRDLEIGLERCSYVSETTGAVLLSICYCSYDQNSIQILPSFEYNRGTAIYDKNLKTRHMFTGLWGKECIDIAKKDHKDKFSHISFKDYIILNYKKFRKIDLNCFNFYS